MGALEWARQGPCLGRRATWPPPGHWLWALRVLSLATYLQGLGLPGSPLPYLTRSPLSIHSPTQTTSQVVLSMTCSRKSMYDFLLLSLLQRMPEVQVRAAILALELMSLLEFSFGDFTLDSSEDLRTPRHDTQFNSFKQLFIIHPAI